MNIFLRLSFEIPTQFSFSFLSRLFDIVARIT